MALKGKKESPENSPEISFNPVHNWDEEKKEEHFFDDGTMTYFWRAHTLTALVFMICFLLYEALLSYQDEDNVDNSKRGIFAMIAAFILLGVTVTPDGPFKRPHPAIWRFTFNCSIVYELILIFCLYQSATGTRNLLKHIDPQLGKPLEEKDYGGSCLIYDKKMPSNPYHNVWDKLDLFVPLHFFGWWIKTLLLRDWWLAWVISIMFEVLEYTLEHQLPNFSECWWDHWLLDALICNGLGIYFGIKTLNYFTMKIYHWRGLWNIPSYRGKLRRIVGQFGPYVWVSYDWKPTSSLGRWFTTLMLIALFLLAELNTFYLKFVLWIPPGHYLNLFRLFLILPWGAVAHREVFQFLDDPDCNEFGRQSWMLLAIIFTETLIILKFGIETVLIPFPKFVIYLWVSIFVSVILWTLWNFVINPHTIKLDPEDVDRRRDHWKHVKAIETKDSFFQSDFLDNLFAQRFSFRNSNQQQKDKKED